MNVRFNTVIAVAAAAATYFVTIDPADAQGRNGSGQSFRSSSGGGGNVSRPATSTRSLQGNTNSSRAVTRTQSSNFSNSNRAATTTRQANTQRSSTTTTSTRNFPANSTRTTNTTTNRGQLGNTTQTGNNTTGRPGAGNLPGNTNQAGNNTTGRPGAGNLPGNTNQAGNNTTGRPGAGNLPGNTNQAGNNTTGRPGAGNLPGNTNQAGNNTTGRPGAGNLPGNTNQAGNNTTGRPGAGNLPGNTNQAGNNTTGRPGAGNLPGNTNQAGNNSTGRPGGINLPGNNNQAGNQGGRGQNFGQNQRNGLGAGNAIRGANFVPNKLTVPAAGFKLGRIAAPRNIVPRLTLQAAPASFAVNRFRPFLQRHWRSAFLWIAIPTIGYVTVPDWAYERFTTYVSQPEPDYHGAVRYLSQVAVQEEGPRVVRVAAAPAPAQIKHTVAIAPEVALDQRFAGFVNRQWSSEFVWISVPRIGNITCPVALYDQVQPMLTQNPPQFTEALALLEEAAAADTVVEEGALNDQAIESVQ